MNRQYHDSKKLILHKENDAFVHFNKSEFNILVTAFLRKTLKGTLCIQNMSPGEGNCWFSFLPECNGNQDTLCSASNILNSTWITYTVLHKLSCQFPWVFTGNLFSSSWCMKQWGNSMHVCKRKNHVMKNRYIFTSRKEMTSMEIVCEGGRVLDPNVTPLSAIQQYHWSKT